TGSKDWIDEAVLERYELLYEAGLVIECARDQARAIPSIRLGDAMASDHRRILATAMSRLRSKIRYRPIVFELMDDEFTLSALQTTVEAILGQRLHKQNFRRGLDRSGVVKATGQMQTQTGGRPAALFRFAREDVQHGTAKILSIPVIKS
ncbi:MAG: NUDIX hydrolase, partial [Henriciella sp.]